MVELVEPAVPALLVAAGLPGLPIPAEAVEPEGELDELAGSLVLADALADGEPDGGVVDALAELDGEASDGDVEALLDEVDGGATLVVELDELDAGGVIVVDELDDVAGGVDDGGVVVVVEVCSTVRSHAVRASALAIAREINIGLFIAILL